VLLEDYGRVGQLLATLRCKLLLEPTSQALKADTGEMETLEDKALHATD
jgi:hypothetical protein